jgi:hypothetical protein
LTAVPKPRISFHSISIQYFSTSTWTGANVVGPGSVAAGLLCTKGWVDATGGRGILDDTAGVCLAKFAGIVDNVMSLEQFHGKRTQTHQQMVSWKDSSKRREGLEFGEPVVVFNSCIISLKLRAVPPLSPLRALLRIKAQPPNIPHGSQNF